MGMKRKGAPSTMPSFSGSADDSTESGTYTNSCSRTKRKRTGKHPQHRNLLQRVEQPQTDCTYGQQSAIPGLENDDDEDYDREELSDPEFSTREALAYLRLVRSEASTLPPIVRAASPSRSSSPELTLPACLDTRGFFSDDAYIAAPTLGPNLPTDYASSTASLTPQAAFTTQLLQRFNVQRTLLSSLSSAPPPPSSSPPPPSHRTLTLHPQPLPHDASAHRAFVTAIKGADPSPRALARLSTCQALRFLKFVPQQLARRRNISGRLSAWVWGLLCRLGCEGGLVDAEGASVLREVGKRAVWVGLGYVTDDGEEKGEEGDENDGYDVTGEELCGDMVGGGEDVEGEGGTRLGAWDLGENGSKGTGEGDVNREHEMLEGTNRMDESRPEDIGMGVSEEDNEPVTPERTKPTSVSDSQSQAAQKSTTLEEAKTRLLRQIEEKTENLCPDANTRATIDMIVTIVGEVFGQRDLLEFRDCWEGPNGLWG